MIFTTLYFIIFIQFKFLDGLKVTIMGNSSKFDFEAESLLPKALTDTEAGFRIDDLSAVF